MNYKSMLKGALALSLGLIAGSAMAANTTTTDTQKYGATFESTVSATAPMNDYAYELGTNITKYAQTTANPSGWFGGEGDESKIIAANGGQALQLNTDAGVLTNKLESTKATEINAGIAAAGAYIETEAKFVASDTLDAGVAGGTDDTKFAIYAYADESKSPCTTNLVVYHKYIDGNNDPQFTNEVFDTLVNCDVYTKIRVEMKQLLDPSTFQPVNVFSVKIGNGSALTSDLAYDDNIWFLTVEDPLGDKTMELSSITFKGTGEVDNLAVGIINETTTYAIDWSASQNVIASNLTDTVQLAAGDTNFVAGVQLGFYPTEGNVITNVNGVTQNPALDVYTYTVNETDTNLTILAGAPALDDNWTIEGFNPRGEWTDPTAVAADSKTLFYSNLVVNIDPIDMAEGRTIPAAWLGAKIIAPEAVTAENVGNWKFDLNATQTGLSFDQCKDGEYFMYLWVPVTAAKVRTAIANQSDIVYTVSVYQEGDSANAQILTMSICPKNIEITNTGDVENGETIDVDDWEENLPAPTVITVAQTIGAHGSSVSNGNFQAAAGVATPITITADQGYVVAQIVTNGAPVADALGETSVTFDAVFSDAEGADNSIVATFAKDNAWFLDPFVRFKANYGASANTFLASLSPDETSFFVGKSPSAGSGAVMFNVPTLLDNLDPAYSPLRNVAASEITDGAALRGGAASSELQLAIAGTLTVGSNWVIPFDNSVAPYKVTHSIGAALDALDFGANSTYLYAGAYTSGYRTKVYKLSFANNLAEGDTLTVEATYDVASAGIARVRAICAETIGGKEYVFVAGGDDSFQGVAVIDTATGTVTRVLDVTLSGQPNQPMSIDIAGIADGTPRMYIGCLGNNSIGTSGFMNVYALSNDGLSAISTEPITTIPSSFLSAKAINVFSLDGETNAVACANASGTTRAYVIEKKPANLIVRGIINQGEADDRSVAFGAAASETFTAPAGETLISVTVNGVDQQIAEGATSFTYEAAELTQYVYIDMQSVEPQYTATYTGSENVIVTNTYDGSSYEWEGGTQVACLSGTVLSFYPTEGNVITNVTIGGVEQTGFDPACYSITVISDTNLVVLAGATARTKPEWANDANDVKFWAWVDGNNVSDYDTVDYSAQYLMNVAPGVTPVLKIDSIQVGPGAAVIIVSATDGTNPISLATINGVLNVAVGSSVTALTPKALGRDPVVSQDGRAMVVISTDDGSFYRARVDFAAAETTLTPAVIGGGE